METIYLTKYKTRWALVVTGTTKPILTSGFPMSEAEAQEWAATHAALRGLTLVAKSKAGRKPGACCPTCGAVRPGGA